MDRDLSGRKQCGDIPFEGARFFHSLFFFFLPLNYVTFQSGRKNIIKKKFRLHFCPQKFEKATPKSCLLMAAPTAQNSPKLHFRFKNYFIQPSLVGSLSLVKKECIFRNNVTPLWP
jgi:hypothetical protein